MLLEREMSYFGAFEHNSSYRFNLAILLGTILEFRCSR